MRKTYVQLYFISLLILLVGCTSRQTNEEDINIYQLYQTTNNRQKKHEDIEPKIQTFNITTLLQEVAYNNAEIKAARYKWKAAEQKYPQVTSLPDPMITYSHFVRNVETRVGPQNHSFSFSQGIPFSQKLHFQGEIAKNDAHIAYLAYEKTIRDVVIKTQQSFYELAYLNGAIEITKKNEDLLAHLLQVAVAENSKDKMATIDVMKGETQLAQLGYDRIRLEELKAVEEGQLNALLNNSPTQKIEIEDFDFLPPSSISEFEKLYNYAVLNNQEIIAANIAINKANNQVSLAFSQYFPDVSVGFTWIQIDKTLSGFNFDFDDDGQDAFAITFSMNLPIWLGKRSAQVQESKFNVEHAEEMQQSLQNQLAADLKKVYYKVSNSERLVKLYQERLLPEAENSMHIAESLYRDGGSTMLNAFETQNVWFNFSLALLRAQTEYAQGLAELAKLCGGNLPISVEEEK